jgi:hypothetical protein
MLLIDHTSLLDDVARRKELWHYPEWIVVETNHIQDDLEG